MSSSATDCIFCGEKLEDDTVLVEKGIESIIQASLKIEDGLHNRLQGKTNITVHRSCRQKYTRPSSIRSTVRQKEACEIGPSTSSALRSSKGKLDYRSDCFICGKPAALDIKSPHYRRKPVHLVSTLEIRETLIAKCEERDDDWGETVKCRLLNVSDLIAPEARYHKYCYRDFFKDVPSKDRVGRPKSNLAEAFENLCDQIENSDECQFTIQELQNMMNDFSGLQESYTNKHLRNILKERFKNRLFFSNVTGRVNIVCSSDTANKLIDQLYVGKERDPATQRMRIVLAAADIIKEDIQKMQYDSQTYPSTDEIRLGGENLVPYSLRNFTDRVTSKKRASDMNKLQRKCAVINHAIISAVRPRSFLSPIQTGIGLTLHRLYGSKHLIDLLAAMGVCVSYNEVSVYMNSLINAGSPKINDDAFIQYVFDNADVNVRTLDGLNTFHALGGIQCIAPSTSVETQIEVKRLSSGSFNPETIRILSYSKRTRHSGLSNIVAKDLNELKRARGITCEIQHTILPINVLWIAGSNTQPGWNGFMASMMSSKEKCDATYVLGIPFINLNPSNPSTLFSALSYASEQCRKQNRICIVTFDQPLYLKSSEIVASAEKGSDLSKVILRLGGFHLLMSFLGSVGKIMEGSGLDDLWASVYGQTTVSHMMNGHAYARCVRAYSLTACAILNVMKDTFPNVKACMQILEAFSKELVDNERCEHDILNDSAVLEALQKLNDCLNTVESLSRTTKLWINLLKCIDLVMRFIYAERSGNWDMHISTTIDMLPYFHAAGHLLYARSAHLYIQQMTQMEMRLSEQDLANFKEKGCFTVRRKGAFWSGTWTDMCIEQGLMRPMKSSGGLTHGRGITDSTLIKWVLGTPFFLKVNEAVEDFLGTAIQYNEQHVELRESRKQRDVCDLLKFTTWLRQHNPFTKLSGELVSLSSGFVCDDSVNCDQAYDIGIMAIEKMKGKNFEELKLHRKDMVKTQAQQKQAKVRSIEVTVNSQQLFHRILCICDSPNKLKSYLEYELAALPPSIFDGVSLRKGMKSSLMKMFEDGVVENIDLNGSTYILDGGFLLHYVPWPKNISYGNIIESYHQFIINKFGKNVIIVFDGYPEAPTTKNEEQSRRASRNSSCDIEFEENTLCVTPKSDFLGNRTNKKKFTQALAAQLMSHGLNVVTTEEDADVDIVKIAINEMTSNSKKVCVVGSDTDLIVLLIALSPGQGKIYFQKEKGGAAPSTVNYSIGKLVEKYRSTRLLLLFIHALTGCDTTSCFYGIGKIKAMEILKSPELSSFAKNFLDPATSKEELLFAGEKIVMSLYGIRKNSTLNEARYYKFLTSTKRSTLRSNFDLAKLPPTSEACHQHLLRVFLQVQKWLGNKLLATDWGWQIETIKQNGTLKKSLKPIATTKPFAPDELLHILSCACKKGCGQYCGCRKANLPCSPMCEHCSGIGCLNSPEYFEEDNVD